MNHPNTLDGFLWVKLFKIAYFAKFERPNLFTDGRPRSMALARPRQPKEQQQRPQMDESSGGGLKLAKKLLPSRGAGGAPKSLIVELCQGQSGAKYFKCASVGYPPDICAPMLFSHLIAMQYGKKMITADSL
jgi:hypothetical protein